MPQALISATNPTYVEVPPDRDNQPVRQHLCPHGCGRRLHVRPEYERRDWPAGLRRIDCDLEFAGYRAQNAFTAYGNILAPAIEAVRNSRRLIATPFLLLLNSWVQTPRPTVMLNTGRPLELPF